MNGSHHVGQTPLELCGSAFSYPDNAILRASSPSVTQLLLSHWAFGAFSPRQFYNFVANDDIFILILLWNIPGLDNSIKIEFFVIFFEGMSRSVTPVW